MRKRRLPRSKMERLMEHFVAGTTARCAAELVDVNFKSAAFFFHRLREIVFAATEDEAPFEGEIEVDESYFGGARKGTRGRGAAGKTPVFGVLKRQGRVYARVIPDATRATLVGIIAKKVVPDSVVYADGFSSYDTLDVAGFKHLRINHNERFAEERNHINGIESFWSQAKRHLRAFNGIPKKNFHLYLRECEWRFNNPNSKTRLKQLRRWSQELLE